MRLLDMSSTMCLVRLDCYVELGVRCFWYPTLVRPNQSLCRSQWTKCRSHTNRILVHHLSQADLVMILGENGQVFKQGSYAEIRDSTESLAQIHCVQPLKPDHDEMEKIDELATPDDLVDPTSPLVTDGKRQTTDLSFYNYYFSALGWARIAALVLFLVSESGISGFRCKLHRNSQQDVRMNLI